ncbi:MAG: hypothetical protein EBT92_14770 [Planctomycetes bacterium]|nr:hypothetical protein [Planctomycetota bacterium]NBY01020.1 hypothetical protein [Planctomycetota bacterium]
MSRGKNQFAFSLVELMVATRLFIHGILGLLIQIVEVKGSNRPLLTKVTKIRCKTRASKR